MTAHEWAERLPALAATHAPEVAPGRFIVLDLPGRVIGNTDHTSHWFRVMGDKRQTLYVRHGMGDESHELHGAPFSADMDSNMAYQMAVAIHFSAKDAARAVEGLTAAKYRSAFVEGRLKKRKARGQDTYRVWIEPAVAE